MDFTHWQRETGRLAREPLETALAAARKGDGEACAQAARNAARVFLRRYLEAIAPDCETKCHSIASLLEEAAARDAFFARLRAEARSLDTGAGAPEDIVDALKEIRLLAGHRAGRALGFSVESDDLDSALKRLVVHSTTAERARSVFAWGALFSFNECVRRGLLSGSPPGVEHLLDPRRCADFVIFGTCEPRYYPGEKVANAHRKGWIDEGLEEDYQPSVRLFFPRQRLMTLTGYEDDGCHLLMIRDRVPLDHLACAAFASEQERSAALAGVPQAERRKALAGRTLAAPRGCCTRPEAYVKTTNDLVKAAIASRGRC